VDGVEIRPETQDARKPNVLDSSSPKTMPECLEVWITLNFIGENENLHREPQLRTKKSKGDRIVAHDAACRLIRKSNIPHGYLRLRMSVTLRSGQVVRT
jgi:hypothetical protein